MTAAIDLEKLCGCCEGVAVLTPDIPFNRPGLNALRYRVGTHGSFLASMLARLASHELQIGEDGSLPPGRPLARLKVRDADDPAIAFLDGWATVADVLTFYQERIANEGYLRTATERRSLLELARLIGYRLRPGVSASTYLAFTIDRTFVLDRAATAVQDFNGKETIVPIPRGSRAASVPGPDEKPQTFETAEEIEARASWSILRPRLTRPSGVTLDRDFDLTEGLHFVGTTTGLRPNDRLLLDFADRAEPRALRVESVTPDVERNRTRVTFQDPDRTEERLREIVAEFTAAMEAHRADPTVADSVNAQDIKTQLIDPPLPRNGRPSAVDRELAGRVVALQKWFDLAQRSNWVVIAPWIAGVLGDVVATAESVRALDGAAPVAANGNGGSPGRDAVIVALRKPPSVPPANARDLDRDQATLYGPTSDLILRLSTGGDPALAGRLAEALGRFDDAPAPILASAQAMRVVAAPFGATAPKRPVFDNRGGVVGEEEWPLSEESVRLKITSVSSPNPENGVDTTTTAEIVLTGGQNPGSATEVLEPQTAETQFDALPVLYSTNGDLWSARFVIFPDDDFDPADDPVTVQIQQTFGGNLEIEFYVEINGQGRYVRPDAPVRTSVGELRIALDLSVADDGQTLILSIAYGKPRAVSIAANPSVLTLDTQYDQIVPGSLVVVERPRLDPRIQVLTVESARVTGYSAYNSAGRATRLDLDGNWLFERPEVDGNEERIVSLGEVRDITVYGQGEPLELAGEPITEDIGGSSVDLDTLVSGMEPGRWLIVSGERTDIPCATRPGDPCTSGVMDAELVMLAAVEQTASGAGRPGEPNVSTLRFAEALEYTYKRESVRIWANVAKATHGETVTEVIGSGAAHQAFQTLPLSQKHLTYLPAVNPLGAESTLQLFVDGIRWAERTEMLELGATERGYITSTSDDEKTTVIGGNGRTGARFPTGSGNISATYRYGTGKAGNVRSEQISQLQSRPLGVQSVINPLAATGGADRDSLTQVRQNAPLAVLALDRLVSVQDYEDFARSRAGIGKASAQLLSDGTRTVVHLTIAGADDVPIAYNSDLYRALVASLREFGDPAVPVVVAARALVLMIVRARVRIDPSRRWDVVEPLIRERLLDRFGFERQELGQSVPASDVIAAIQAEPGVAYVDLDVLWGEPEDSSLAQLANLSTTLQGQPPPDQWIEASLAGYRVERQAVEVGPGTGIAERPREFAARTGIPLNELLRLNPGLEEDAFIPSLTLVTFRGIRPARLVLLSRSLPDTLILQEIPT